MIRRINKINHKLPNISIIFPNYNGGKEPLECLESITGLTYPRHLIEVIVIDNGSIDGSKEAITYFFPWVKLIENKTNYGFAPAINLGIKSSKGSLIFIGNDDLVFASQSISVLVSHFDQTPETGIAGGTIFFKNAPQSISSSGFYIHRYTGNISIGKPFVFSHPDWIQGCALMVRRSVIDTIGVLDENYSKIYFEDSDFCFKARKSGYTIDYVPEAVFFHGQSTTMDKNKRQKYYYWYKNKIRFILINFSSINIYSVLLVQIIIIPIRIVTFWDGRFISIVLGFFWNFSNLYETLNNRKKSNKLTDLLSK